MPAACATATSDQTRRFATATSDQTWSTDLRSWALRSRPNSLALQREQRCHLHEGASRIMLDPATRASGRAPWQSSPLRSSTLPHGARHLVTIHALSTSSEGMQLAQPSQHEGQIVVASAGAVVDRPVRVRPGAVEVHVTGVEERAQNHLTQ